MTTIPDLKPFDELIQHLKANEIGAIEYGDVHAPQGILSLLRIRYLPTNAGMQYCIKFLSLGKEGSGIYFPATPQGIRELHDHVICYIDRHNQKVATSKRAEMLRIRTASFFGISK